MNIFCYFKKISCIITAKKNRNYRYEQGFLFALANAFPSNFLYIYKKKKKNSYLQQERSWSSCQEETESQLPILPHLKLLRTRWM